MDLGAGFFSAFFWTRATASSWDLTRGELADVVFERGEVARVGAGGFRAAGLGRRLRLGGEGLGHDVHALADGGDAGGQRAGVGVGGNDRERADVGAKRDRHRDEDAQDDGPEGEGGPSTDAGRGGALLVVAEVVVVAVIVVRRGGGAAGARLLHRRGGATPRGSTAFGDHAPGGRTRPPSPRRPRWTRGCGDLVDSCVSRRARGSNRRANACVMIARGARRLQR